MISNSGTTSLGLYDFKRQIDAFGGVDYFRPSLAGGYLPNARVMLNNGEIVQNSTTGKLTNDPNTNMSGWVKTNSASQIFDESGDSLQEVNNLVNLNYLTDYKTIEDLSNAFLSLRNASVNGILYKWDDLSSAPVDGFYVVGSSISPTGRWLQVNQNSYRSSLSSAISGAFKSGKMISFDSTVPTTETISIAEDNIKIVGYGDSTGFIYTGSNGSETALNNLKPVIAAKRASIANAISSLKISDINVNMSNASNICGIDGRYITNNSKFDGVSVTGIGVNSVGFYISKQWYSRYVDCRARGVVANNRQGIGVYIDTTSDASTVNQVNAVPIDISVRELQYGILVNPARYIYSLIIPSSVTIEKCQTGLKVVGTDSAYIVRNTVISAHFEANDIDAEWGSSTDTRTLDQKITWLGCSFNDTGSKVILNQGQHEFIGCTGLETLIVNNTATVNIRNTLIDTITNNTGNARAVVNNIGANQSAGASQYGALTARSLKAVSLTATATVGTDTVTFDFLNLSQTLFSGATPTRGQKVHVMAFARRSVDTTTGYAWRGTLVRIASGWHLVPDSGTWNITASINNSGVLSLSSSGADLKYYDVVAQVF